MAAKNLYDSNNNFVGSVDNDGRIYDEKHWYMGKVEGDKIYDYRNIKLGEIRANGDIWDINHNYVGTQSGQNFLGPMRQYQGMERDGHYGTNHGSDLGAFRVLKNFKDKTWDNPPTNDYGVSLDPANDGDDGDNDPWADDGGSDWDDYDASPRSSGSSRSQWDGGDAMVGDEAGCVIGCLARIIAILMVVGPLVALYFYCK